MKILWKYRYVEQGQLEPDAFGRWMIEGRVKVHAKHISGYEKFNRPMYVTVAHIHQKPDGFIVSDKEVYTFKGEYPYFYDLDNGMDKGAAYGTSVEDVQRQVEERLKRTINIFKYAK
jgi:hypothetical protein